MAFCNFNCLCLDSDCKFSHTYPIKDRRIIRNIFDKINNPDKNEPNPDTRRANCRFGQLCYNKNCGFRHRLAFDVRIKLLDAFNNVKLQSAKVEKEPKVIKVEVFNISNFNAFNLLDNNDDVPIDVPIDVPNEVPIDVPIDVPIEKKSWADIVGNDDDDDFYMKFD